MTTPADSQSYDIPFVPSSDDCTAAMVRLAQPLSETNAVDLGAGNGKLVLALARGGANATGIEIDLNRYHLAIASIKRCRLAHRAHMINGNMWEQDLSKYDLIVLYGVPSIMERLKRKIINETQVGCRVISNHFTFPGWRPIKTINNVFLYDLTRSNLHN